MRAVAVAYLLLVGLCSLALGLDGLTTIGLAAATNALAWSLAAAAVQDENREFSFFFCATDKKIRDPYKMERDEDAKCYFVL
jgi:hypothetical protein